MTIKLTAKKTQTLLELIQKALQSQTKIKIRDIAQIIGHMVSAFPAIQYGPLYYRNLEHDKTAALKLSKGNYDAFMSISKLGLIELTWWQNNISTSYKSIITPPVDVIIYSDAPLKGWGAAFEDMSTGGHWSPEEGNDHINILELKAALFAIKSFASKIKGKHVKIMIDNTAAVYIINNMGTSHNNACNTITTGL